MPSSEDMMRHRVLQNELDEIEFHKKGKFTDEDMVVRKWLKNRIKDLTEEDKQSKMIL